jgi:hypothetical protein
LENYKNVETPKIQVIFRTNNCIQKEPKLPPNLWF